MARGNKMVTASSTVRPQSTVRVIGQDLARTRHSMSSMKFEKLEHALSSGLLERNLCSFPTPPTRADVDAFNRLRDWPPDSDHVELLVRWGGASLDEIRINSLARVRQEAHTQGVSFANDYNGQVFWYDRSGVVYKEDTDGGEIRKLAVSIDSFINNVFLGAECAPIYSEDWLERLSSHGLVA